MDFLPAEWEWEGLSVRDVREDEVDLVSTLHMACSDVGTVDKSFVPVSMKEYDGLVRASLEGRSEGNPFRLQIMSWNGEPCGYFHAYGNHPRTGAFFVSMFLIIPSLSRQGLGRKAAAGITKQAKSLGFSKILLSVFLANRDALSFWIDQGFDRLEKFRRTEETGRPDWLVLGKDL